MRGRLLLIGVLAALVCPAALRAQWAPATQFSQPESPGSDDAAPAHVAYVDGVVSLEREGRADSSPLNMPLLSGDRLRTVDGRVEVLFGDGSTLHLDARSTIDVQSDELVRLTAGRLRLNIPGPLDTVLDGPVGSLSYRIDSPAGSARITQPGEYRIALLTNSGTNETQLEIAVVRGGAEIFTDQGTTPVRAGERAYASAGLVPSYAYAYNSANQDTFDRWSEGRRDARLGVSSQYLPPDMQAYAPLLEESGDWRYTESNGHAWYPRVSDEWRPYYHGRWASYPRYGWTWIGADRFAWPTHHYGRWGFSAGVWFWKPSSRWAPANVSWSYAPGYVSWCPLGFDNRPIFGINIDGAGPGSYSSWRGWTAVSYSQFGRRDHWVHQRAVNWDRVSGPRPRFENRGSAPGHSRDVAVTRNSAPIRWAGSRHLPPKGGSHEVGRGNARRSGSPSRDRTSLGRGSATPRRDTASSAPGDSRLPPASRDSRLPPASRDSQLPPSGGRNERDTASPAPSRVEGRATAGTPRYINRGDEVIRSQTGRPTPPPSSAGSAVPRSDPRSGPRTIPDGPVDGSQGGPARPARPEIERHTPSFDRPAAQDRSRPYGGGATPIPSDRPSYRTPGREAVAPAGTRTRPDHAAQGRPYEGAQERTRAHDRPRPGPDAGPSPAPSRVESPAPERAAPSERAPAPRPMERAPARAPSRVEGPDRGDSRQAPPERSAPSAGTGGERAVSRAAGGGASAPRPRGRGGL